MKKSPELNALRSAGLHKEMSRANISRLARALKTVMRYTGGGEEGRKEWDEILGLATRENTTLNVSKVTRLVDYRSLGSHLT